MKGNGDHGSIVPLNLQLRQPVLASPVMKSETHEARAEREGRRGTPPTRWGMYNGVMPQTQPAMVTGPELVLAIHKAVTDPAMAGTGSGDSVSRKRDPSTGKFTQAPTAGPQTTATDDLAAQERNAHLAQRRMAAKGIEDMMAGGAPAQNPPQPPGAQQAMAGQGGGGQTPPGAAMPPGGAGGPAGAGGPQLARPKPPAPANPMQQQGMPSAPPGQTGAQSAMGAAANDPNAQQGPEAGGMGQDPGAGQDPGMGQDPGAGGDPQAGMAGPMPMGMTPEGLPIYDDPYNPAHSTFTPDQHRAAADLHNQQAEMATSTGRIPSALDQQLKARIHMDLANDARSPMERMLSQQGMPGTAGGAASPMGQTAAGTPNMRTGGTGAGAQNPMDDFLANLPDKNPGMKNGTDMNKPLQPGPMANQGPLPNMQNTNTGTPIGPQSQQAQHAGTVEQPQMMPESPPPGNGSMPEISGPQPAPMDALDWNPTDFEVGDEGQSGEGGAVENVGQPGSPAGEAPPSHAGAATEPGPDEGVNPTPGSAESEPPTTGGGPSVKDNTPFTKREEMAEKSFSSWFNNL